MLAKYVGRASQHSLFITDLIIGEVISHITRLQKRLERTQFERSEFLRLLGIFEHSSLVKVDQVAKDYYGPAYTLTKKNPEMTASLVDWSSLLYARDRKINVILTFDKDFKAITHKFREFSAIKIWNH